MWVHARGYMNILLTLGRMPKGLDLARGLSAAGHTVFVADPHKNHVCRYSNAVQTSFRVSAPNINVDAYVDDMRAIVDANDIDMVIPISEESVFAAQIAEHLPSGVGFFGPTFNTARQLHDKFHFNRAAQGLGLPAPETALLGTPEAEDLAARYDVIVKPVHGSAGIGIECVPKGSSLPTKTSRPSLVQRQLKGRLVTSMSIAKDGACLGTGVYEGTIFSGSVAIAFQRADDTDPAHAWARMFIENTNYTGFLSFDMFIEDDGQAYAIECNPRLTSGIHLFDTESVARAITTDDAAPPVRLRERRKFQHFWPALGNVEASIVTGGFFDKAPHFFKSADITFDGRDPMPFVMFNFCSGEIFKNWIGKKMSLGEAAITDIEWREPEGDREPGISAAVPGT